MTLKKGQPVFAKLATASALLLIFGAILYFRSSKEKMDYEMVKGRIDFINTDFEDLHPRDMRYIHVAGQEKVFQIFVGKETGDFSPKFEKLDSLKLGNEIVVYHSGETPFQQNRDFRLNKNAEFIDKDNQPYFIRGSKNKIAGIIFMGLGAFFILGLYILKSLKKIL